MKISIITVTYNSARTLRHTIESVIMQSYSDFEYIIIDGASTDGTLDIIKEYVPKFNGKLKYISEKDNGLYDAMNKGLRLCTGDIVGILNSDDFYTTTTILQRINEEMQDPAIDAIYGDVHYVEDCNLHKIVRYYSSKFFTPGMMRLGFIPAHPSFYCRRECYERTGYFNTSYKVAADFEILLRLIYINRIKTKYIATDFVTMRTGGASSSGIESYKSIMRDHRKALKAHNVYSNILILALRYIYKIFELVVGELLYRKPIPAEIDFIKIYDSKNS